MILRFQSDGGFRPVPARGRRKDSAGENLRGARRAQIPHPALHLEPIQLKRFNAAARNGLNRFNAALRLESVQFPSKGKAPSLAQRGFREAIGRGLRLYMIIPACRH